MGDGKEKVTVTSMAYFKTYRHMSADSLKNIFANMKHT